MTKNIEVTTRIQHQKQTEKQSTLTSPRLLYERHHHPQEQIKGGFNEVEEKIGKSKKIQGNEEFSAPFQ